MNSQTVMPVSANTGYGMPSVGTRPISARNSAEDGGERDRLHDRPRAADQVWR